MAMLSRSFAFALALQLGLAASAVAAPGKPPKAAASNGHAAFCARIGSYGCCHGETLLYCRDGVAHALDCRSRPRCGWRETGRYDCDTAGSADPKGRYPRFCVIPDAGIPLDLGPTTAKGCGPISEEGCCFGDELRFCEDGVLRRIDCRDNRFCGWRGVAQAYNCGTQGGAEPKGKHPRLCPGAPDAGPRRFPDLLVPMTSPARSGGCGCACQLGGEAAGSSSLLALFALLWLVRRRRRR